ncbi:MAG: HlyD family efflux transporter periplasmic adaptor subunit [Pirellula sp.]
MNGPTTLTLMLRTPRIGLCSFGAIAMVGSLVGCNPSSNANLPSRLLADPIVSRPVTMVESAKPGQVLAQGRLQPARGFVRLSALPGDRIEQILVKPGQAVQKGQRLLVMQSLQLRTLELEAAIMRREEAQNALLVKRDESQLAIDAATLKQESASKMLEQAVSQQKLTLKGNEQLQSLTKQIDQLQSLRNSPLTRAAIGTVELESKKNELLRVSSMSEQASLAAEQAVELGKLQVTQAKRGLDAAIQASRLVDRASPIASLEKQIELIRLQVEQAKMESPIDGVVISVNAEPGERTAQIPLIELANLAEMVCVAEVHEADVARIAVDDPVELRSSSLATKLKGRVQRIDRVVGAVQLRFPNPMARSDFRAIPVWIAIDASDAVAASERLQLQVEATIFATR